MGCVAKPIAPPWGILRISPLLFTLFAWFPCAGAAPPETSRVTSELGVVEEGKQIEHTFTLMNNSALPWRIKRLGVSCSCLEIERAPKVIPPGGREGIRVRLSTEGRRGRLTQAAYIDVDDGSLRTFELIVSCIVPGIWFEPPSLDLGDVYRGETAARDVCLCLSGVDTGLLPTVVSDDPRIRVELSDRVGKAVGLKPVSRDVLATNVRVLWDGKAEHPDATRLLAVFHATVTASLEVDRLSPALLSVRGESGGFLKSEPTRIFFGTIDSDTSCVRHCRVAPRPGKPLDLSSLQITSDHRDWLSCKATAERDGAFIITMTLSPKDIRRPTIANGLVKVSDDGRVVLVIPYSASLVGTPGANGPSR